ncbi:hypothetical protein MYX06_02050 [Patescibacteria group bacterium AH-259-L05]|nr:hypothetical protein [Patescibacteria group bacterium AH-259-L05]
MDSVVFWGIEFRSVTHMEWFQTSIEFFVTTILLFMLMGILVKIGQAEPELLFIPVVFWVVLIFFHGLASFAAYIITKGGAINGPAWSVDCIWFNALVAGVYIVFCLITARYWKKLKVKTGP